MGSFFAVVPAKTSQAIVTRLNAESVKALALPDVRQQFASQGIEALGGTLAEFAAYIQQEIAKWARVIKLSGARVD